MGPTAPSRVDDLMGVFARDHGRLSALAGPLIKDRRQAEDLVIDVHPGLRHRVAFEDRAAAGVCVQAAVLDQARDALRRPAVGTRVQ